MKQMHTYQGKMMVAANPQLSFPAVTGKHDPQWNCKYVRVGPSFYSHVSWTHGMFSSYRLYWGLLWIKNCFFFPWFLFNVFASTVVMLWISCSWECALLLRGQQLWPSCAAIAPQLYSHKDRCLPFTPQCLCLRVKQSRAVKMLSGFSRLSGTPVPCSGLQPCLQTHWLLVLGAAVELCSHSCECCRDDDVWL